MENTSKLTNPLSRRIVAYYRRRQQNRVFAELAKFFASEAERGRITRKAIAEKIGKDPGQITRWLAAPSNLELDTISDLLLAMNAELDYCVVRFADRAKPNYAHPLSIQSAASTEDANYVRRQIIKPVERSGAAALLPPKTETESQAPIISPTVNLFEHASI
jgi:hypothetical protein